MFESGGDKFKHPSEMYQDAIDTVKSSRSYSKERRKTVRAKRPVQQRKGKICPICNGDKHLFQNGNFSKKPCWRCGGKGRLSPVA